MIGKQILNYTITAHLGQGGMGNVYKATDTMLGRDVALKMLHPQLTSQSQFLERFRKEARILAQLLHPNIAVIYNFFEQQDEYFMVMEYVEGENVDELLKQFGNIPVSLAVPISIQALEGLQHAHRKSIFHRDIKPANLMITREDLVKLMDFGIAKVSGEQKLTQVNKIVGTIEFMAPELIQGKDASTASDIYSMGATLYEMVTGKVPFREDSDYNLMQAIMKSKPLAPHKLNAAIPESLSNIIMRAMDKDPANRFTDARAFQAALIHAFPRYQQVDLSILKSSEMGMETRVVQTEMETRFAGSNTASSQVKQLFLNPAESLDRLKEKFNSKRKWVLLVLALLILSVSGYFIFRSNPDKKDGLAENNVSKPESETKKSDRNPYETPQETTTDLTPSGGGQSRLPQNVPVEGEEKGNQTPRNPVNKEENNRRRSSVTVISGEDSRKESGENTKEQEAQTPKTIHVSGGTRITMRLVSRVDMNQAKKSEQSAKFSVTRPVYQNGVLIIREGATASGSITVGRVMTDIKIYEVETVTGKRIPVRSDKAHGRRSDLEGGGSYIATVLPGSVIQF